MPAPTAARAITLPAPVGGINLRDSFATMDPSYSPWLINADAENGYVAARPGIINYVSGAGVGTHPGSFIALGSFSSSPLGDYKLYGWYRPSDAFAQSQIIDLAAGTVAFTTPSKTPSAVTAYSFASHTFFMTNYETNNDNTIFDGSSWSAVNLTGGLAPSYFIVGYKGHLYGAGASLAYGWHSTIGGIAGATNAEDLTNFFETKGYIAFIAPFSSADGLTNDVFLAFGSSSGEILVYSGENPGSSTWSLRARFKVGKPLGYQAWIPYNNDALLLTETGLVSLRSLFTTGYSAEINNTLSALVDPYWIALVKNQAQNYWNPPFNQWSGVYWPEKKRILILANGAMSSDLGTYYTTSGNLYTIFSLNLLTNAWSIWQPQPGILSGPSNVNSLTYFNGKVYLCVGGEVQKIDDTVFHDNYYDEVGGVARSYTASITGAYSNLGMPAQVKKVSALELIQSSDFASNKISAFLQGDFTPVPATVNRTTTSTTYGTTNRTAYLVGAKGVYHQYGVSLTSDTSSTTGYKLYATNVVYEPGGLLS